MENIAEKAAYWVFALKGEIMAVFGYLRVSTEGQENEKFKDAILRYSNDKQLGNVRFVEEKVSGKVDWKKRSLGELIATCGVGDIIIVPELSRLGRSISMIYQIIENCQNKGVEIHSLKQNLIIKDKNDMPTKIMINTFAMVAEIERDFVSMRTKEALQAKKRSGVKLGRPCGIGKSKLDAYAPEIKALRNNGSTFTFISKRYGASPITIKRWFDKH